MSHEKWALALQCNRMYVVCWWLCEIIRKNVLNAFLDVVFFPLRLSLDFPKNKISQTYVMLNQLKNKKNKLHMVTDVYTTPQKQKKEFSLKKNREHASNLFIKSIQNGW